jgi:hypothetical protein
MPKGFTKKKMEKKNGRNKKRKTQTKKYWGGGPKSKRKSTSSPEVLIDETEGPRPDELARVNEIIATVDPNYPARDVIQGILDGIERSPVNTPVKAAAGGIINQEHTPPAPSVIISGGPGQFDWGISTPTSPGVIAHLRSLLQRVTYRQGPPVPIKEIAPVIKRKKEDMCIRCHIRVKDKKNTHELCRVCSRNDEGDGGGRSSK